MLPNRREIRQAVAKVFKQHKGILFNTPALAAIVSGHFQVQVTEYVLISDMVKEYLRRSRKYEITSMYGGGIRERRPSE